MRLQSFRAEYDGNLFPSDPSLCMRCTGVQGRRVLLGSSDTKGEGRKEGRKEGRRVGARKKYHRTFAVRVQMLSRGME